MTDDYEEQLEFLSPLVQAWLGQLEESRQARKAFDLVGDMCREFFCGAIDFMWEEKFRNRFLGGGKMAAPNFKITLNRAFDYVARYGPELYWDNPLRVIKEPEPFEYGPEAFGDPNDPYVQELFGMAQQERGRTEVDDSMRRALWTKYLNYTPREQPYGGLAQASELMIIDALVTGRGVLWPRTYRMPGSQRRLTGCFFEDQRNLLIDPDARCGLDDAQWIALKCVDQTWKVEKEFKLPPGTLEGKGQFESGNARGGRESDLFALDKSKRGTRGDLLVYYKVWTRMGTGARISGVSTDMLRHLDREAGDYCYLVVTDAVPWPLNAPAAKVLGTTDRDGIRRMFKWPVEYWADNKWPCALLDFYRKTDSAYPIPPMAAGLGQLVYMNVFMSHLANRTWTAARDFMVCKESAKDFVKPVLDAGEDLSLFTLPDGFDDIQKELGFLKQPNISPDAFTMIDRISLDFEKSVALTPYSYGMDGGAASRSSADAQGKLRNLDVRPSYMRRKVAACHGELADMEKFCARMKLKGEDFEPVLAVGPIGKMLADRFIFTEDPEMTVRNCRATIEAQSIRRPNRERDLENINTLYPQLLPILSEHANVSGDSRPLNAALRIWRHALEAHEWDDELEMGPRAPMPPPPEVVEAQNRQMAADEAQQNAKTQSMVLKAQADQAKAQADMSGKMIDLAIKQRELDFGERKAHLDAAGAAAKIESERIKADQELASDVREHQWTSAMRLQEHMQKMDEAEQLAAAKLRIQREMARAKKPKYQTNGSKK